MLIGEKQSFALQIDEADARAKLAHVKVFVGGVEVGNDREIYLPVFLSEIAALGRVHAVTRQQCVDFAEMSVSEVFSLLSETLDGKEVDPRLDYDEVWGYHGVHSLDDKMDGWTAFVFDHNGLKTIVARRDTSEFDSGVRVHDLIFATLGEGRFSGVIEEFVAGVESLRG